MKTSKVYASPVLESLGEYRDIVLQNNPVGSIDNQPIIQGGMVNS